MIRAEAGINHNGQINKANILIEILKQDKFDHILKKSFYDIK